MMRDRPGFFITIEGIDGCGKSTQAARLAAWLEGIGQNPLRTFEPGGWAGGEGLRSLVLMGGAPDVRTELLLFLADRSGHLASVVLPALEEGRIVLCERYVDSTWAYQVGGRGLDPAWAQSLMKGCAFPDPDLTIFLKIEPEAAARRLAGRGGVDHIEAGGLGFMTRVAGAYEELARSKERILTVPAEGTEDEVARCVVEAISGRLEALKGTGGPGS